MKTIIAALLCVTACGPALIKQLPNGVYEAYVDTEEAASLAAGKHCGGEGFEVWQSEKKRLPTWYFRCGDRAHAPR